MKFSIDYRKWKIKEIKGLDDDWGDSQIIFEPLEAIDGEEKLLITALSYFEVSYEFETMLYCLDIDIGDDDPIHLGHYVYYPKEGFKPYSYFPEEWIDKTKALQEEFGVEFINAV